MRKNLISKDQFLAEGNEKHDSVIMTRHFSMFGAALVLILTTLLPVCNRSEPSRRIEVSTEEKIAGDRVNLRQSPEKQGRILKVLSQGDKVTILSVTEEREKKEGEEAWVEVESEDGVRGWVYGPHIDYQSYLKKLALVPEGFFRPRRATRLWYDRCRALTFENKKDAEEAQIENRYLCRKTELSDSAWKLLQERGFIMERSFPDTSHIKEGENHEAGYNLIRDEMILLYGDSSNQGGMGNILQIDKERKYPDYTLTPLYYSSDYIVHAYHLIEQQVILDSEERYLHDELKRFAKEATLSALTKMKIENKNELKDIALYFLTAHQLLSLDEQPNEWDMIKVPLLKTLLPVAKSEAQNIRSNINQNSQTFKGIRYSYRDFQPHGRFKLNEKISNYYRALRYLSIPISKEEGIFTDTLTELINEDEKLKKQEIRLRKVLTFIYGKPRKNQFTLFSPPKHSGQRWYAILSSGQDVHKKGTRPLPSTMDIMGIAGSDIAERELQPTLHAKHDFKNNYALLKFEFEDLFKRGYLKSIPEGELTLIASMFQPMPDGLPRFVYTPEWKYRRVTGALGMFADFQNDDNLMSVVKKSKVKDDEDSFFSTQKERLYTTGTPWVPHGYIEPDHLLFSRLLSHVQELQEFLSNQDILTLESNAKLKHYIKILEFTLNVVEKEQKNAQMDEDEFVMLATLGREILNTVMLPIESGIYPPSHLAFIKTVAEDDATNSVVFIASGLPYKGYVLLNDVNGGRVCVGYFLSFYERISSRTALPDASAYQKLFQHNPSAHPLYETPLGEKLPFVNDTARKFPEQ